MAVDGDPMGELGLQEVLNRLDRLSTSVEQNVDRVTDHVIKLDNKVDTLVEGQARLEGTLEGHIASEETWRREVSERINLVDVEAKHRAKEAKEEALKVAIEAKVLAEAAGKAKSDWGVRWQTVVAMVVFVATLVTIMVGYDKLTDPTKVNNNISVPARP